MSVSAVFNALLKVTETLPVGAEAADAMTRIHKVLAAYTGTNGELTASTAPAGTKVWSREITLSAGAASLVMTSLAETFNGTTVNKTFLGLKVHLWLFVAHPDNTEFVGVSDANHALFGPDVLLAGSGVGTGIQIPPGGFRMGGDNGDGTTVAASPSPTVSFSSVDLTAKVLVIIVAGT